MVIVDTTVTLTVGLTTEQGFLGGLPEPDTPVPMPAYDSRGSARWVILSNAGTFYVVSGADKGAVLRITGFYYT